MSETTPPYSDVPDLRRQGWVRRLCLGRRSPVDGLLYDNGEIGIEHACTRPRDDLTVLIAPTLTPGGHQVVSIDPLTVTPSVLCSDCGLHGFITDGVWRSV